MTDVADRVNQAWEKVHVDKDADARVPREDFIKCMLSEVPADEALRDDYEKYLNKLFDASLALNLGKSCDDYGKTDLGKHCFGYASVLAQEFYFGADDAAQPKDELALKAEEKPADRLATVREEMDKDWEEIEKDGDGRVTKDTFVAFYVEKFDECFDEDECNPPDSYKAFLEKDFDAATAMMLPKDKSSLGGHCFRYAGLMAGEFYFEDLPVTDILRIATTAATIAAEEWVKNEGRTAAKAAEDEPAPAAAAPAVAEDKPEPAAAYAYVDVAATRANVYVDGSWRPRYPHRGSYSLEELQNGCPEGVAKSEKEVSLKDDDFQTAFKMSRADFEKLPKWKKDAAKKACKIF